MAPTGDRAAAKGRVAAIVVSAAARPFAALGGKMREDVLEAMRDQARSHPLRVKILALVLGKGQSLNPKELHQKLPDRPPVERIEYHLRVLRRVKLLPPL